MIKKPFFSIVIPTYNRADLLKATIAIILEQTFHDFEIIISNNASTDNTKKIVKSFKDPRIKYFENKKNLGAEPNMKKAISYARGNYIFTLGDDDFILYENTLKEVKKILDEKHYGFVRLNLIERKFIGEGIRKSILQINDNIAIGKNAKPKKILEFILQTAASHFAGLVIKNEPNMADKMIDSVETAWIKIIFESIKKYGAFFLGNHYMIITWSQGGILNHYELKKSRIMGENYIETVLSYFPKEEKENVKLQYYNKFIILQPVIKLYGGIRQLVIFNRRLLHVEKKIGYNIFFWINFAIALIIPRVAWRIVRVIQHRTKNSIRELPDFGKVEKRYAYFHEVYSL